LKNLKFMYQKKFIPKILVFLLIINSFMFTDALLNQAYASPSISEMNITTTDNEVSVYGTGDGNGNVLAEKPFRYTIGSSQSEWVRDSSNITINETLTSETLSNTRVVNNNLVLTTSGGGVGFLNGYFYRSTITVDHSKISSDLTNFPLTVCLNSSNFDFDKAKADGSDIRFTDKNLNSLKFEREEHSAANVKAVYNVLVPAISNTVDTEIYMWYGNPNAYNTSIEAWQDKSGKQFVYNGNVKLQYNATHSRRVATFDGSGDYFSLTDPTNFIFGTGDFCIEFQYMTNVIDTEQMLYDSRPVGIHGLYVSIGKNTSNKITFYHSGAVKISSTTSIAPGTLYNITVSRIGGVTRLFVNGVQEGSSLSDTNSYTCATGRPWIGANSYNSGGSINGYILGVRITKGRGRYSSTFTLPTSFEIDGSDVVLCSNFDTIYDQNYAMVQHMGNILVDASGSGNNGAATGTTVVDTEYGKARSFNGSINYITTPLKHNASQFTILSLLKFKDLKTQDIFIDDGYGYVNYGIEGSDIKFGIYDNAPSVILRDATTYLNSYTTFTGRHFSGTPSLMYIDGSSVGSSSRNVGNVGNVNNILTIGKNGSYYANIDLAELRYSNIARSDAWIKAESLSLKNSLVTYSDPIASLQYASSGTRESVVYDISGSVSGSRIQWAESKPAGTNVIVESNVSLDGGSSWLGWKPCTNGSAIADLSSGSNTSNARLKLRQTLSTSSGAVTPSISNSVITINFSKYVHRITADPNKEYTVKFEVKDASGNTTSETRKVYSKAQGPLFTVSGSTENTVDLLFSDANPTTTEYQIMCDSSYINSSGVMTSVPTWITLKNKSITVLGLNIGTMYNFTAKARNASEEETNYASPIYIGTEGIPVPTGSAILAATALNYSVNLGWNEIPNSLSYELELDGAVKNVGLRTDYIHKDLMTNTQHTYRVRGRNQGGFSDWSELLIISTTNNLPLIPANALAKASNDSVSVYWNSAQDALTYTVEIDDTQITDVSKNSACLFGLEPETTYTYRVKACNLAGESEWSETGSITTHYLDTPEILLQETDSNGIKIGWEKVEGATTYEIALDSNENFDTLYASDLEEFATSSSITYIHDNLPIRSAHVYRVRAICGDGNSAWSDSVTLETLPQRPAVPANFRGNASNNFITLIWNAVQDAIGYDLEVDGIVIENDNTPQYQYKGLDQYTEHTYRVRSVNNEIQSYWSDMLKIRTVGGVPEEPKNVIITNSRGIATLDWDKTMGAQNYDIEVDNNTIYSISKDTFIYRNVGLITSSTAIYKETVYRIRAGNDLGKSDWTGYHVNNAIMGKVEKGKELDLGLTASNIMDFSRYTLYVNYNDKALTVTDLCAYSVEKELTPGMVEGHDIEIVRFEPGHIVFRVNRIIDEGYLWTGIINNIKFMGNATGGSTLTYTAQCSKD